MQAPPETRPDCDRPTSASVSSYFKLEPTARAVRDAY